MTHVKTSPYYPQSNGKVERWHGTLNVIAVPYVPLSIADARQLVAGFVEHYNQVRLHSAIGYVAPAEQLAGREPAIFAARDQKLAAAKETPGQATQRADSAVRQRTRNSEKG